MTIDLTCPQCSAEYKVKDELAGRSAKCKKCGTAIEIPKPSVDDYELYLADDDIAPAPSAAAPAADDAADAESPAAQLCPMCGSEMPPGVELCMTCGYEGEVEGQKPPVDREEYEAKLRGQVAEPIASKIVRWTILSVVVLACISALAFGGMWVMGKITKSRGQSRIATIVESVINGQVQDPKPAAAKVADDIAYLPAYVASVSSQADRIKQTNLNLGGLKYSPDGPYPQFLVEYSGSPLGFDAELFKDIPRAWQDAAAISTLIVNLPESCDIEPLVHMHGTVAADAAKTLLGQRTGTDWQITKSCDADESVRALAAELLLDRLGADATKSAALESLAQATTPDEKRKTFDQLKQQFGSAKE